MLCLDRDIRIQLLAVSINIEKCWDFFVFGLIFLKFGYVPDFFYVSKKLRKSLGHRKVSVFVLFTNKIFKKTRQK